MARFKFTGTIGISDNFVKTDKCSDGKTNYKRINLSVIQAKNNRAFCEVFATEQKVIKTKDVDGNDIEIEVANANDTDVIAKVANYKKHTVRLSDDERYDFIYDYEFVSFLEEHKDDLKDKKFLVTGTVKKNYYKGEISDKFTIQNIYAVDEDAKCKLIVEMDEFWTVDDYDFADFANEHKVYLNGKTSAYFDKKTLGTEKGANKYVDQQVILDATKIDFEKEAHTELLDFKLAQIGLKRDDQKISTSLKKKKVYRLGLVCTYVNGQEKVEFDESTLTPNQKMAIKLGLNKPEDFAPKGDAYGTRVELYKINSFNLVDDAADGCYDSGLTIDEYEEEFFVTPSEESLDEVVAKAEKASTPEEDDELDDLFD